LYVTKMRLRMAKQEGKEKAREGMVKNASRQQKRIEGKVCNGRSKQKWKS
jgi:hypothetical protein